MGNKCNKEVYEKGTTVAMISEGGSENIEWLTKEASLRSKQKVDWFYMAGRGIVKAVGDIEKVRQTLLDLYPEYRKKAIAYCVAEYPGIHPDGIDGKEFEKYHMMIIYDRNGYNLVGHTLVLMRGIPGSGKSTRAREIGGTILSTDEFFMVNGKYVFDIKKIGEAHAWNRARAKDAIARKDRVIVIDNTNVTIAEMRPYTMMALDSYVYSIEVEEPTSKWWKTFKPNMTDAQEAKLAATFFEKNTHGVPLAVIQSMMKKWEFDVRSSDLISDAFRNRQK